MPYTDNKKLTGSIRYASINTHLGIEQSRRDDLESLGYMFVYFLKGKLPWQNLKVSTSDDKIFQTLKKKLGTPLSVLCADLPSKPQTHAKTVLEEIIKYFEYVRGLKFEQKPDYEYMRSIFRDLFYRRNCGEWLAFDWSSKNVTLTS